MATVPCESAPGGVVGLRPPLKGVNARPRPQNPRRSRSKLRPRHGLPGKTPSA
ncbi:hypothetical protein LU631_21790 [Erwinia tracheiphila]|uniref:hypothetical protein n=1 Tax=Erwinia tracheiphila TaxID=65700 RepID=UPI0003A5B011|nr:hypothetical protein [Erwinia tracheiphila]UIA87327.1 hypothetical protein LU631_21790 [Erwinia tracheiphila]UIA95691.1 hypothetical protein LU633_20235 [Erwinia tracheiphila]